MPTIQDILQYYFSPTTFKQSAQKIIPVRLNTLNDLSIDKLQKITEEVGASFFSFTSSNLIPHVFRKFKSYVNNSNVIFERRELRTLTYSLTYSEQNIQSIFSNEHETNRALALLDDEWRDSFLIGLIDCFLKNWETKNQKSLELLDQFIDKKMVNYTGNRSTLKSFKDNKRFFNKRNGDLILGDTIAKLNKPIQEATKILGVPESWLTYPYFSKVIVTYYERTKNNIGNQIDSLNDVLLKHKRLTTNKRLISKIIIQVNQPQLVTLQDKVKKMAFKQIGDPSNVFRWTTFENTTEAEETEIKEAKKILNEWITKQFISVFFEKCINDQQRKKFWLPFASKISSFKVYGPVQTKYMLKQDERISEYVDARFETVSSHRDISAFVLYTNNYMLIEFSNAGYAFYGYEINSPRKPNVSRNLNSIDDLVNGDMPMAVTRRYSEIKDHNKEGRLRHQNGTFQDGSTLEWSSVFEWWFKKYNVFEL